MSDLPEGPIEITRFDGRTSQSFRPCQKINTLRLIRLVRLANCVLGGDFIVLLLFTLSFSLIDIFYIYTFTFLYYPLRRRKWPRCHASRQQGKVSTPDLEQRFLIAAEHGSLADVKKCTHWPAPYQSENPRAPLRHIDRPFHAPECLVYNTVGTLGYRS
jgi:hypothetical protein